MAIQHFSASRSDAEELRFFTAVYEEACQRVSEDGTILLTTQVCETIANSIATMAALGERNRERLCGRAMREVEAYDGVKRPSWAAAEAKAAPLPLLLSD